MSNPESSENKTVQAKGKHQKPVPKFMSLTWLRLHMNVFIYAVVATFVVSLFFIGYGTVLDYRRNSRNESEYKDSIVKEAEKKFALPAALQGKGDEKVFNLCYNANNATYSMALSVKTVLRNLINSKETVKATNNELLNSLTQQAILALYAKANNILTDDFINKILEYEKARSEQNNSKDFEYKLIRKGQTEEDFKEDYLLATAPFVVFPRVLTKMPSASATEDLIKAYYENHKLAFKKDNKISFDHLLVSPSDFVDADKITDEQITAYYEANKSEFLTSNRADVSHIFINFKDKEFVDAVDVDEKEIKTIYDSSDDRFKEKEQVKASHILIKPRGEGDEEKKLEEAKKVALEIYEKAKNGEDFAKLATENSEDTGSAKVGGELGFFGRGVMVKEFEDAAFSSEIGTITEPVKTNFGYHIIKVEDKTSERVKPYEEVKDTLIQEKKAELAEQTAENQITEIYFDVFGSYKNAPKFLKYVEKFSKGGSAKNQGRLPLFFKGELTEDYTDADKAILKEELCEGSDSIYPDIEKAIFALENTKNIESVVFPCFSDIVKTSNGYHIFMINGFKEPVQMKLTDNLKKKIKDIIAHKNADEEAQKVVLSLVKDNASAKIDEIAKAYGKEKDEKQHSFSGLSFKENNEPISGYELFVGINQFSYFSNRGCNYIPEVQKAMLEAVKTKNFNNYLTPFKSEYGWHIIKITDYQSDLFDTFEESRDTIRHILTFEPSDSEINNYYQAHKSQFDKPATRAIRQIVSGNPDPEASSKQDPNMAIYKETIEKAYKELESGASFSNVARKYSSDPTAANGGEMPEMAKGSYDSKMEEVIWSLKVSDYSKPFQREDGAWVIVKVENETPAVEGNLSQTAIDGIKNMYIKEYQQLAANYFFRELTNKTKIERNQELIDLIQ